MEFRVISLLQKQRKRNQRLVLFYVSPEAYTTDLYDGFTADIWSLGIMLLITGMYIDIYLIHWKIQHNEP